MTDFVIPEQIFILLILIIVCAVIIIVVSQWKKVSDSKNAVKMLEKGKFLKHIHFRFPVYYNGTVIDDISWENGSTVETVALVSRVNK